ncbi:Tn3 family transposase [Streptosporangium sp. NBC_01495]|uniref:Tn3 family transposase n=1 Tax=Streptosporangium sp. NBC_01495 TaxID=2903899 RepID=UPI002E30620B|nr:Tn3 family transposase [Streptosporangium sp. NBC_01495]
MATQVFADEELERLREFPEIGRDELARFFTLTPADVAFVDPGRGRGPADRLGLAVALCTLPWLGFVPDKVLSAPPVAMARLAEQLGVDPTGLRSYGRRAKTRTEHLRLVAKYLGWRLPTTLELKELDEFLLARAMEHDSPTLLFRLGCEYLISARVIRPGLVTVVERVAHARAEAQRETFDRLAHEFTEARCAALDGLLITDPEIRMTRLRWLATGPVEASPAAVEAEVAKLEFLRSLGADGLDLSALPAERRRFLATVGRRLTAQALERRDPQRRYPILLTMLAQSATDVLDEVVQLFDQAISARESRAERKMRDGLRSGDVFVPGSRRYSDPAAYLLPPDKWVDQRAEFCQLVGKPADPDRALAAAADELGEALGELEGVLAAGDGLVRLDDGGDLVISPLTAEDVPAEATALKAELTEMLPFAPIVSLLIELDKRTGYLDCFTHASGKQARSPELKRNLIAVLLAHSTNLGLTRMADACGISYDVLAWTSEWYVREETLRAANLAIIDYHQRLPLIPIFGTGTLSSSDGQRFPTRGKSVTARALSRYFASEGLSTYTHVTDQHTTYGTKVIVATKREAHYVLDEILRNATDIPVTEHATDTHGVTLVNFGLFDLLGLQLSPRIRDLGKITLYRAGSRAQVEADFPHTGPLLTRKLNTDLIAEHYDDLLRLAGSLKFGHATASLLVGKLSAAGRQNALAAALKEYGALRRTIYAARYLADPAYRRKISRQLNKGESLHALKRDLLYAHEGAIRARHLEAQTEQAWCLTLATNAVVAWTTEYYGLAVESMRRAGRRIDDEILAHISPAHSENINFFGAIEVDIEGELAQLGRCASATRCSDGLPSRGALGVGGIAPSGAPSVVGAEKTTLSCVGAGRGRYSRILPGTCGRWSPSEMPKRRELVGDLQRGEGAWLAL